MYPILLRIGPITVGSYGVVVLLSGLTAYALLPRYARRYRIDPDVAQSMFVVAFIAGWAGSRIANVFLRWDEVVANPRLLLTFVQQGGLWYGSLVGGLVVAIVFTARHHLPVWRLLDMIAVPAVVGGGLGRIGCLMSGCCHGRPADVPWAITFTNPAAHRLHAGLPSVPVHPTQLYELLAALGIGLVIDRFGRHRRPAGQAAMLWFILYGVARSVIEFYRGDAIRGTLLGPLSTSQTIGILTVIVAALLFAVRGRRHEVATARP